jgi:hypothetical protein
MPISYTQQEVEERAKRILSQAGSLRQGTINQFFNMSRGETEYGLRETYYPGKPNQFFSDVLAIVNESEEQEG